MAGRSKLVEAAKSWRRNKAVVFSEEVTLPAAVGGVEQGLLPELQLYFLSTADKTGKAIKVILLCSKRDQSIVLGEDVDANLLVETVSDCKNPT